LSKLLKSMLSNSSSKFCFLSPISTLVTPTWSCSASSSPESASGKCQFPRLQYAPSGTIGTEYVRNLRTHLKLDSCSYRWTCDSCFRTPTN
jgi:hypothetical protein